MSSIIEEQFRRGDVLWVAVGRPGTWMAMWPEHIERMFNVPDTAKQLWFKLFSDPGNKRYREPLRVRKPRWSLRAAVELFSQEAHFVYDHILFDEPLTLYVGKLVYLEVWYE